MAVLEIMKDLFFIERGYLNSNHFLYRSEDPVLIDTGYISDFSDTERFINQLGVNISDVRQIINTHCHCDHIGGNRIIQEKSGCDIALHKIGKHFIDTQDDWSTWWKYYNQKADFFTCTRALEDGEVIPVGSHKFKILHTPGHASDGIALYNKAEKVAIRYIVWVNFLSFRLSYKKGSVKKQPYQGQALRVLASLTALTALIFHTVFEIATAIEARLPLWLKKLDARHGSFSMTVFTHTKQR